MANRAQRRNLTKGKGKGRVTAKKEKAPTAWVTVTDEEGNTKRVAVKGERVSEEEAEAQRAVIERSRRAQAEQEAAQLRVRAHVRGIWLPGDPLPGQG